MREKDVMKIQNIREEMKGLRRFFQCAASGGRGMPGRNCPPGSLEKKETAQDWNSWKQKRIM